MTDKDAFKFAMWENIITLENTIVDAKNKKDSLNSRMFKVLSLLKEVEHIEKIADEAVDKAKRTSLYILAMMEEIKQAKQRTKEANEKRAREVYEQKIVLYTAMKKLQFRVSDVLNEEVVSLGDLDKMIISLEKRLTSALEKKLAADEEELETIMALNNEKRLMRKLEAESKRLEQDEMENSKIQEFIISRGHVVDMIQENISCNVKLLKDGGINCKDENENLDSDKSLREVERRVEEAVDH